MIELRKFLKAGQFNEQAEQSFAFVRDLGFFGPERREDWISFSSGDLGVEVIYDDRDGRVLTIVRAFFAERSPRAGLGCLYVSSGLGPQQNIRDIARSEKQLKASLESQAEAFRKVLPVLSGPDGPDLLLRCHGR